MARWPFALGALAVLSCAVALVAYATVRPAAPKPMARAPRPPAATPTRAVAPAPSPTTVPPTPMLTVAQREKNAGATTASVPDLQPTAATTPIPIPGQPPGSSRFAFLLMGYGGPGHDGPYLTDSMIVMIVDVDHQTLTMLSLPRDAWVPLSFDGQSVVYNKVNTAYAFAEDPSLYPDRLAKYSGDHGAGVFASDTVSRLLGVPVSYYAAIDFQGFRNMIDTVGGIDVNVPDGFSAQYPINDNPSINAGWTVVTFQPGLQHMDGERAIEYARAREAIDNPSEGSDFARSRRQRLILEAFKARLLQPGGLLHLPQLLSIAATHIDTNYALPSVATISQLILDWQNVHFYQTALTTQNYLNEGTGPDGTYLLVPATPDHSWQAIRAFSQVLWNDPAAGVAMAATQIAIENDSNVAGLGDQVATALAARGYLVGAVTSGTPQPTSQLIDQSGGEGLPLVPHLTEALGLPNPAVDPGATGDVPTLLLKLGEDATGVDVTVPTDPAAPVSDVGLQAPPAAVAYPAPAPPAPAPTDTPAPAPRPVPRATPIPVPGNPNFVVVPNLVGLPLPVADRIIQQSGLMTTYVNYQTINQVPNRRFFLSIRPGAVLSQIPAPGQRVERDTRVMLAVRKS
jgi:LCP family protein required for cell wall assembly